MEVRCTHCKAKLTIPKEKIPSGKRVAITCPRCKERFFLELPKEQNGYLEGLDGSGYEYRDVEEALQLTYEEGEKLCLMMGSDDIDVQTVREAVEGVGYRFITAEDTRGALSKMRFHHFAMVILCDRFDGVELDHSPIVNYMNHLPMSTRRRIFFVLIGDQFRSMDQMMAFAKSVNLVVNKKDLDKMAPILKRALADHEMFYKVFMETLAEVGKA
ncbi:MAG: zinc-ribbon domain-containing protein [Deltaproteobacteria bacterium]|nr:zinc-ribbon domain-containing protein [Deltaproteobacteria bacterium]MBW1928810.1 zinc-ribbon domain-containing protein [Deltaproteobacteria bacterium]MBW2026109.1 zinc-ribbon domain-containing protein [Deltaproteobacteria bacterium]MBW2125856.1 zinc-ribbon domain-containing protein [Deltaproteobacteria bacterium]RLB19372.1 MAG: hypothetical protein DRG63_01055 [Deltaproteobacteria bacterium]